jgi:hypothetical protein
MPSKKATQEEQPLGINLILRIIYPTKLWFVVGEFLHRARWLCSGLVRLMGKANDEE